MLRAVARYLRQAGIPFSDRYMEQTLLAHAGRGAARWSSSSTRASTRTGDRARRGRRAWPRSRRAIDAVDCSTRTASCAASSVGRAGDAAHELLPAGPKPYVSFKLDPTQVPLMPLPRPRFEIFVHSPRVEGVHLRGGSVARGGLRWSDRREDFRTEILGLMKAQMVKNALIVPVGAKGGFVVKRAGDEVVARSTRRSSARCWTSPTRSRGGEVVPPARRRAPRRRRPVPGGRRRQGHGDVLATSPTGSREDYGFWLGDAFASGGSVGYDHKAMGITARSAWVSVQRHFRELGVDVQAEDFTVVGIGDMSGDVFGNGMLLSRAHPARGRVRPPPHLPRPDPGRGVARSPSARRLFELPRSSWADYDTSLISEGGGVFPRTAKSIPLTEQVREALDVDAERLTPSELIQAILRAPVDLLWNGGIGTYVKATSETHADVGDKANDARARQRRATCARRSSARAATSASRSAGGSSSRSAAGKVNTDAIDNAGGVNCSDHEVNIKVLLDAVVAEGDMTVKQRNALLAEMTDAVAERVLRGSYTQTQALSLARAQAPAMLDVHDRFMRDLEAAGRLDRAIEALPGRRDVIAERRHGRARAHAARAGGRAGLQRRSRSTRRCWTPTCPRTRRSTASSTRYFPSPLPERFGDVIAPAPAAARDHRHARDQRPDRPRGHDVRVPPARGHRRVARPTSRAPRWSRATCSTCARCGREIEALDGARRRPTSQIEMLLSARRMVERATRWLLRTRPRPLDIAAEVERYGDGARRSSPARCRACSSSPSRRAWRERVGAAHRARACPRRWPAAWRRRARCSPRSTSSRSRGATERDGRGGRRAALPARRQPAPALAARPDRAARRATRAGRRWRARRCATTSSACTPS